MAIFGLITERKDIVLKFIKDTNIRFGEDNLVKNPFNGKIYTATTEEGELLHIVDITPVFMNITYIGWVLAVIAYMLGGVSWWLTPGIVMGCAGIFWHSIFYKWIYRKGLKKAGYKGKLKPVKYRDILLMLCNMRGVKNGSIGSPRLNEEIKKAE